MVVAKLNRESNMLSQKILTIAIISLYISHSGSQFSIPQGEENDKNEKIKIYIVLSVSLYTKLLG